MRHPWPRFVLSMLGACLVMTATSWAGQIVREETRLWAEKVLQEEKTLKKATAVPAPNSLGVLYFHNRTGNTQLDSLQKGLTLMLITDLAKVKEIQVIERVKIQALLEEMALGATGLIGPDKAPRVGRLLGVENLVGGDILMLKAERFQLKANLLKVPTEKIFGQPLTEGQLLNELFKMEKELVFEIIKYFKIELAAEKRAELREYLTKSLRALVHFFDGIYQSDLGDLDKARRLYVKALDEDPDFILAVEAIREIDNLTEKECKALRNRLLKGFSTQPRR